MRHHATALVIALVVAPTASAQVRVSDPAVTTRNTIAAAVMELMVTTQTQQHSQMRRMAQRLSMFTDLAKYGMRDAPRWRIHDFENPDLFLFSRPYHAAMNYGDPNGAAYLAISHPLVAAAPLLGRLGFDARRSVASRLATVDIADAAAIAGTNDTGRIRYNGRRELTAIDALEAHVIDPSLEQSATAVLDKISGASLIGARQRQARIELLAGVVEQLLVEGKRARDTDAAAMNMQLVTWRDARAVNDAFARGTGDALRAWRQP